MAFFVSWVRILALFVSPADPKVVLPTLELPEEALPSPSPSPVSGNPPVIVVSSTTPAGFHPAKKAKKSRGKHYYDYGCYYNFWFGHSLMIILN